MRLLLIDTCGSGSGSEASFALADTDAAAPIVELVRMPGRTASEGLITGIRAALAERQWRLGSLAAIGIVNGPGSFTGLRVGLAAAKGLSEAAGLPLVGVSRLLLLAAAVAGEDANVCALLDAGRGEFYCGMYRAGVRLEESMQGLEGVLAKFRVATVSVACEAAVQQALAGCGTLRLVLEPTAADALAPVMRRLHEGVVDDAATLDANYLRSSDLEIFAKPARPAQP